MSYPRIYLAVNNCFAAGRWTTAEQWIQIIRKWGIRYMEASSDVEADPLYMGPGEIRHWGIEVDSAAKRYGITISGINTGQRTCSILGLTHTDADMPRRIQENWLKPVINTAANLKSRFSFFCHTIPQNVLHDTEAYNKTYKKLIEHLTYISLYAREQNLSTIAIEQKASPEQPPWTINGARRMLAEVYAAHKAPMYLAINTGLALGQSRYLTPMVQHLATAVRIVREGGDLGKVWLGTKAAYDLIEDEAGGHESIPAVVRALRPKMREQVDKHPWLFATDEDADIYRWIEEFGAFSPVIHLQQTDGKTPRPLPFTTENNITGMIDPKKVLQALTKSYQRPQPHGLPPMCDEVFLTLTIASESGRRPREILDSMRRSVIFWRKFIPEDGVSLEDVTGKVDEPIEEIRRPGWMLPGSKMKGAE